MQVRVTVGLRWKVNQRSLRGSLSPSHYEWIDGLSGSRTIEGLWCGRREAFNNAFIYQSVRNRLHIFWKCLLIPAVSHRARGFGLPSQQHLMEAFLISEQEHGAYSSDPPTISAGSHCSARARLNPEKAAPRKSLLRCTAQITRINAAEALLALPRLSPLRRHHE